MTTVAPLGEQVAVLPPPVRRYLEFALGADAGRRSIVHAHLRFTGTFAARPNAWAPFTAVQQVDPCEPGFVWDARIRMMPLVSVHVRDSYVAGRGAMRATIAGLFPIVNQHGTREIAQASLQRFLAEAVWFPTVLLAHDGLVWSPVSDTSARVTLTDRGTTATVDVTFSARGEIERVSAMRYRDVKGTPVLTPWVGHHADYREIDGMMIPTTGEVAWVMPNGPIPYWRGKLVDAGYEY